MHRSTRLVLIAAVAAGAMLAAAAPAVAAPLPAVGPDAGGTVATHPVDASAEVGLVDAPPQLEADRIESAESAVLAAVRLSLASLPESEAGHVAQILKNLGQGTL